MQQEPKRSFVVPARLKDFLLRPRKAGNIPMKPHPMRPYLAASFVFFSLSLLLLHWDKGLSDWIRFQPGLKRFFETDELNRIVRAFGKADVLVCVAFAIGAAGLRRQAIKTLLALLIVMVLIWPFKLGINRLRPYGNYGGSFPSGDTAAVAAFTVPLVFSSIGFLPVVAVGTGAVALLRVHDGAHYPSDVSAGIGFGLIAGVLATLLYRCRRLKIRWSCFILLVFLFPVGRSIVGTSQKGWIEFLTFLKIAGPAFFFPIAARFIRIGARKWSHLHHFERAREKRITRIALAIVLLLTLGIYAFEAIRSTL